MIYLLKNVQINKVSMLYYNRIDVSEEIGVSKESASKKCDICHYWFF